MQNLLTMTVCEIALEMPQTTRVFEQFWPNAGLLPTLAVAVFTVLGLRSAVVLARFRRPTKALRIWVWEMIYGAADGTRVAVNWTGAGGAVGIYLG